MNEHQIDLEELIAESKANEIPDLPHYQFVISQTIMKRLREMGYTEKDVRRRVGADELVIAQDMPEK